MKFTAIVPLKANSQRVPRKNFILIAGKPLFIHIFETLLKVPMIDRVVCWSSDEIFKDLLPDHIEFIKRDSYLDGDSVNARELFTAASDQIDTDYFVLCHATAPFIQATSISKGILSIFDGYDSAFSVKEIKNYAWFQGNTLNYSLNNPVQTQKLDSVFYETSGFFIYKRELMLAEGRRIGYQPKMIKVSDIEAIDIDEETDLEFAKLLEGQIYKQHATTSYTLLQKRYKHVIFDMDGVLINSLPNMKIAWKESGGELYNSFEKYKELIGIPFQQICIKLNVPNDKMHEIEERYFSIIKNQLAKVDLYDGVLETLSFLQKNNIKISIVTSKEYNLSIAILEHYGITVDSIIAPNKNNGSFLNCVGRS